MPLIDTHCHLTFSPLAEDIDQVIQRSMQAGIAGWITIGTDLEHSQRAIDLASRIPNLFVAVGIHPHEAGKVAEDDLRHLADLAKAKKVVAVGETGLDLHYLYSSAEDQKRVFVWHLDLAAQLGLPLVVHCREAFDPTLEVLDRYRDGSTQVVFHCFTGTMAQARTVVDRGFYLSFSGVVTFKNAKEVQEAAENVPLDRVLIETDCPYLSPEPMRKQRANEPALMVHTARFIAGLRRMDLESLIETLTCNARRFFHLL
jgi:TatD DNase family protein